MRRPLRGHSGMLALACLLGAGCLASAGGCAATGGAPLAASAGLYDRATLRYELDGARLGAAATRVEGQQVSYETGPGTLLAGQSKGVLLVEYPHPELGADMARATVELRPVGSATHEGWWGRLRQRVGGESEEAHERWVLDVPRPQLDQVLSRLEEAGYFGPQGDLAGGTKLEIELEGAKIKKVIAPLPELDALVTRVRSQGQLLTYRRAAGSDLKAQVANMWGARGREDQRAGSQWPVEATALAGRARGGAWPVPMVPSAAPVSPAAVQPVSYLAAPTVSPPGQAAPRGPVAPEMVALPPTGNTVQLPALPAANVPPEMPLMPPAAPSNVARLPSPPATPWR